MHCVLVRSIRYNDFANAVVFMWYVKDWCKSCYEIQAAIPLQLKNILLWHLVITVFFLSFDNTAQITYTSIGDQTIVLKCIHHHVDCNNQWRHVKPCSSECPVTRCEVYSPALQPWWLAGEAANSPLLTSPRCHMLLVFFLTATLCDIKYK